MLSGKYGRNGNKENILHNAFYSIKSIKLSYKFKQGDLRTNKLYIVLLKQYENLYILLLILLKEDSLLL